jgi:hypothetical protein
MKRGLSIEKFLEKVAAIAAKASERRTTKTK